jgi:hypothetical protein
MGRRHSRIAIGIGIISSLLASWAEVRSAEIPSPKPGAVRAQSSSVANIEIRGRVVCLSEEMKRSFGADVPEKHTHDYGIKGTDGKYYSLVRTLKSEALLTDTNLHSKDFILKGRVFPNSQLLEITGNLHAIREGRIYELSYYCDICSIKSSIPGPCMCCREPVYLKEELVKEEPVK